MSPWMSVAVASVVGALAFFFAGYVLRGAGSARRHRRAAVPPGLGLQSLLERLADETGCQAVALLDHHGLVVQAVRMTEPQALALAGSLATAIGDARRHGLATGPSVFELQLGDGRPVRLFCADVSDRLYVVATIGADAPPAPDLEHEVLTAIPRLQAA